MKIFVAYARIDASDLAEQIQRHFSSSERYEVFTDVRSIKLGDIWSSTIADNISKCDIFVVIVTYGALHSEYVENEVLQAQRDKKKIIPCFHRNVARSDIKWGLNEIQGVEFEDKFELARNLYPKITSEVGYLPGKYDYLAPDTSEIRILAYMKDGELHTLPEEHEARAPLVKGDGVLTHCTLPPGKISFAVMHQTVQEAWYCFQGKGQVWRKQGRQEIVVDVEPGITLTIPTKTHFQFRNTSDNEPLSFLILTLPPWPGPQEANRVEGKWH